jgi:hypothetical protein
MHWTRRSIDPCRLRRDYDATFNQAHRSTNGSKPYNVHEDTSSTLDPGRHLTRLDVTWLLPFNLPWIASHTASYREIVSANMQ